MKKYDNNSRIWLSAILFILALILGLTIGVFDIGPKNTPVETKTVSLPASGNDIITSTSNFSASIKSLEEVNGVSIDGAPFIGNTQEAKAVIVEFADYQCPYCKKYFDETFAQIRDKYVNTGKIIYAFRDYPLESHPQALHAAYAADCAYLQNKFWEMHDLLYSRQDQWSYNNDHRTVFMNFAKELNLNMDAFTACYDQEQPMAKIQKDIVDGQLYKVSGTPTFFINNKKLMGAQPFKVFTAVIDQELKTALPLTPQTQQTQQPKN